MSKGITKISNGITEVHKNSLKENEICTDGNSIIFKVNDRRAHEN